MMLKMDRKQKQQNKCFLSFTRKTDDFFLCLFDDSFASITIVHKVFSLQGGSVMFVYNEKLQV